MRTQSRFSECVSRIWPRSADKEGRRMLKPCRLFLLFLTIPAWSQQKPIDITEMSIEDLMNIKVTSVSKKEEKFSHTAAAIFVITPGRHPPLGRDEYSRSLTHGSGTGRGAGQRKHVGHQLPRF